MTQSSPVSELLTRAAAGRGALLSRREMRAFEQVSVSELVENLRDLGRHGDVCRGKGSVEIFGASETAELGDAPAWIDAGAVYEDLIQHIADRGELDTIFCLDPWAAQLRSRMGEIAASAQWILVSDLGERKRKDKKEYWDQLEEWMHSLSFSAMAPKQVWDQTLIPQEPAPESPSVPRASSGRLHAAKPGAWQWRKVSPEARLSAIFLVRYSGSLSHLRVFLDSLVRQEGPASAFPCVLLVSGDGEDPKPYLRWFGLAHQDLPLTVLTTSADLAGAWKDELAGLLERAGEATLVLIGDHTILPSGFAQAVGEKGASSLESIPLSPEVSSHIITGNLDAVAHYEALLRGGAQDAAKRAEIGRILPARSWRVGEGDVVSRILRLAQDKRKPERSGVRTLLELADLP